MLDYNKIAAKNSDIDNIRNGVSVKSITTNRASQNGISNVKSKFKEYTEQYNGNGEKTKSLSTQKSKLKNSGEVKYKNKDYFYSEDAGGKSLQIKKQDKYKIIEGNKAEKKFNRVLKRNS